MSQRKFNIYLSCSLTGAAAQGQRQFEQALRMYEILRAVVIGAMPDVYLWVPHMESHHLKMGDPQYAERIYDLDSAAIAQADACLAVLNHPSHGAGAEIQSFVSARKPVAALVPPRYVSMYIRGMIKRLSDQTPNLMRGFYIHGFDNRDTVCAASLEACQYLRRSVIGT